MCWQAVVKINGVRVTRVIGKDKVKVLNRAQHAARRFYRPAGMFSIALMKYKENV